MSSVKAAQAEWESFPLGSVLALSSGDFIPSRDYRESAGLAMVVGAGGPIGQTSRPPNTPGPAVIIGRVGAAGAVHFFVQPVFATDNTLIAHPSAELDPRYLYHYLRSVDWAPLQSGSSQPLITQKTVKALEIPLPSRDAQTRIAELLDVVHTRVVAGTARLRAGSRAIERFRQAVLVAACSGRLTSEWRASYLCDPVGPGPALSVRALANDSGSPNTDRLIEIPETWGWWSVETITEKVIDYRGRTPPNQSSGPIPHVRTTQIRDGRIDWVTNRFVTQDIYDIYMTRGIPHRDDVLFTMEAPMGEVGVVDRDEPFSLAQRILLMRPGDQVTGEYLALALRSHPVRRAIEYRATGSGVLGVAYKRLRSVLLPIPPLEEQGEIVTRAHQLLAYADRIQRRIDAAATRINRSSQAILAKAFRGELIQAGGEEVRGEPAVEVTP